MKALLTMALAVVVISACMIAALFLKIHWPTLIWTVALAAGYVLQVLALYFASKAQKTD